MSLMKTLAKVAVAVAVAKGAKTMMDQSGRPREGFGDDGLFGGARSPATRGGAGTGLEGMMDRVLGGAGRRGESTAGGPTGGLGGLLEQLAGGGASGQTRSGGRIGGGGLDDLLGQLGGAGGLGGILGGLAGALGGSAGGAAGQEREGSFGEVLNSQFDSTPEPARRPTASQEAAAGLMIRAMIQAAKSDGTFDAGEQRRITEQLGDIGSGDRAFVDEEFRRPVDPEGLAASVPKGLEQQVYTVSVIGIDLDSRAEAEYLDRLARGMGLGKEQVNAIHRQLGVPALYA